jgi:hypothetical protein
MEYPHMNQKYIKAEEITKDDQFYVNGKFKDIDKINKVDGKVFMEINKKKFIYNSDDRLIINKLDYSHKLNKARSESEIINLLRKW